MTDFRLGSNVGLTAVTFDLLKSPLGMLDETRELETAIKVALGTDRRADEDDILPGLDDTDRRGWWGDYEAEQIWNAWPVGSRIWLLSRTAITSERSRQGNVLALAEQYCYDALAPFVTRGIASRVSVTAERRGDSAIVVQVVVYRGPKPSVQLQFQSLWDDLQ